MAGDADKLDLPSIAPAPLSEGALIDGKYRVQAALGEGAMGTVMAAHHVLLDLPVAVKLLSPELVHHPQVVERFLREARAVARLKSEHVAHVMDVGTLEGGQPYIVMELLEGEDLDRMLSRVGSLPLDRAIDYVLQALEAMSQAHAVGIVHRDLKPANLFVTVAPDGGEVVKVLDFGIAKLSSLSGLAGKNTGGLTGDHSVLGSPSYMAPEQVQNMRDIDVRADIWAIGTVLYEALTGRPAFSGHSVGEIFGAVLHVAPPSVRSLRPEIPEALDAAVARCLKRSRDERFDDVAQLAAALAPFGSGALGAYVQRIERTLARQGKSSDPQRTGRRSLVTTGERGSPLVAFAVTDRGAFHHNSTLPEHPTTPPVVPRRSLRVPLIAGGAVAVGLAATLAVVFLRSGRTHSPASSSAEAVQAPPSAVSVMPAASSQAPPSSTTPGDVASVIPPSSTPARTAKPGSRPTPPPSKPHAGALPRVLDSPE
jgi:serine/threonine-protein kinase